MNLDAITGMSLMEGQKDIFKEAKEKFWQTFWVSQNLVSKFFILLKKVWAISFGTLWGEMWEGLLKEMLHQDITIFTVKIFHL